MRVYIKGYGYEPIEANLGEFLITIAANLNRRFKEDGNKFFKINDTIHRIENIAVIENEKQPVKNPMYYHKIFFRDYMKSSYTLIIPSNSNLDKINEFLQSSDNLYYQFVLIENFLINKNFIEKIA